jgi:hypothetical protein
MMLAWELLLILPSPLPLLPQQTRHRRSYRVKPQPKYFTLENANSSSVLIVGKMTLSFAIGA